MTRDPGDEIENEVTNSETFNSGTFFSQASCRVASFPLVLDLMHECYVISFPDIFHFLIWRSSCFVAYFHMSTSHKLWGDEIGILFLNLGRRENSDKLQLVSTNKTDVYSLLVTFDVLWLHVATKKKINLCEQYFVFWFIQILNSSNLFLIVVFGKTWSANGIKLSPSYKKFRRVVFKRAPLIAKSIFIREYQHQYTCCFILHFSYLT